MNNRVWDKKNKQMLTNFWLNPAGEPCYNTGVGFGWIEEYVLMWSTGLFDMYRKEIYDGDIIKCMTEETFKDTHGNYVYKEVIYRNGVWLASYLSSEKGNILPKGYTSCELAAYRQNTSKDAYFSDSDDFKILDVEVIYNIYENPLDQS